MAATSTSPTDRLLGCSPTPGQTPTAKATSSVDASLAALRAHDLLLLVESVCARRGVTVPQVCGRVRSQNVCRARQEAWWRIRHHPTRNYSYHEIATLFGRDHSTVKCGIDSYQRALSKPTATHPAAAVVPCSSPGSVSSPPPSTLDPVKLALAPELRFFDALDTLLQLTLSALVAADPALDDPERPYWLCHSPPTTHAAACRIATLAHQLRHQLDRYRQLANRESSNATAHDPIGF
jgi:hypothetical protein